MSWKPPSRITRTTSALLAAKEGEDFKSTTEYGGLSMTVQVQGSIDGMWSLASMVNHFPIL